MAKKTEALARLSGMEKKYFDLVWIARRSGGEKEGLAAAERVRTMYPEEVARLSGEEGAWEHGFNSGCLAAFRFALGIMGNKTEQQMAEDEFPFLDT